MKKYYAIWFGLISAILLFIGAFFIVKKLNLSQKDSITSIEYSFGNGYGIPYGIVLTISNDGQAKLYSNSGSGNDYENEESIRIESNKYKSLEKYIKEHMDVFAIEDRSDYDVYDAGYTHIVIKLENGEEYKTGGYAAGIGNDDYAQMYSRILSTVGEKYFYQYREKVENYYRNQ